MNSLIGTGAQGLASTQPGSANDVMSWALDSTAAVSEWVQTAVAIKAAPVSAIRSGGFNIQRMDDAEDEGHFNELDVRNWYRAMVPA